MTKKIIIVVVLVGTLTIAGIVYRYQQTDYRNSSKTGGIIATSSQPSNTIAISSSRTQQQTASSSVSTSLKSGFIVVNVGHLGNAITRGQFEVPDLRNGDRIELRWVSNSDTRYYGDEAEICLHAFDAQGTLVRSHLSSGPCIYGGHVIYSDLQSSGVLGMTTVSGERYEISVDLKKWESLFVSKPTSYTLSVFVLDKLPSENRSEWAGLVSMMSSTLFTVR